MIVVKEKDEKRLVWSEIEFMRAWLSFWSLVSRDSASYFGVALSKSGFELHVLGAVFLSFSFESFT